jgi:DNA-binding NarL/FixJ family response regulator
MIKVLLVDDHHLFREGIARILQDAPGMSLLASAENGVTAITLAKQHQPDVILMDVHMPEVDGIEATRQILQNDPDTQILMLTVSEKDEDLFAALRCGARGYLLKDTTSQELIESIRRVHAGEAIINPLMAAKLLDEFSALSQDMPVRASAQSPDMETEKLTSRERDVLQLVARGLSNKDIGDKLSISPHTVKTHLSNTLEKLNLNGRVEAAAWAIRHGLLKGD